jgi:hypothetical protein
MKSSSRTPARGRLLLPVSAALLAVLGTQCLLLPDDNFTGQIVANQRPIVRITGGVLEDSLNIDENRVHFYWYGADNDGVIRWFEWAVDDTISEEAWHRTTSFDEWIFTKATEFQERGGYSDWHSFYVRSVDDQYSHSRPDIRLFNAHTIAPTSEIQEPHPIDGARWAATLRMTWFGEDLDATSADKAPAYYEIKHVQDTGVDVTRPSEVERLFEESRNLLLAPVEEQFPDDSAKVYYERASRAWKRVPGTVTEQWLEGMTIGSRYGFAVRAIDEAGAMEQGVFNHRNVNWVIFQVRTALITVVVFEPSMGNHRFDSSVFGEPWEVTVAPGQRFRFQWVADASASGTEPGPCNYGFDIPDPADPTEPFRATDGKGGWIGWAPRQQMQDAISFPQDGPKEHYFYLKMRDISNKKETETKCIVKITVAQFGFTKKFLVVDDQRRRPQSPWSNAVRPDDSLEDAWRDGVFKSMADFLPLGEQPGLHNMFPDEGTSPSIDIPDNFLDTMGEHQTILWDCAGGEDVGLELSASDMLLSRYVGAGGNLMLFCWVGPVSKITMEFSERAPAPKEPQPDDLSDGQAWNRFGFLWQHLHLRGAVDKPRGEDKYRDRQSLVRAVAADPVYPDIPLDYSRWGSDPRDPTNKRGDHYFECLVPTPSETGIAPWYEREQGLEPIYTARCYTNINHNLNDKPIAWRTFVTEEDLRVGLRRGKIVCFAFHPYYFQATETETAVSLSLMWLAGGSQ